MPLSRSRDYLSIGEVLDQLQEEFPDVSISKIRFLESEGLIHPERTSSGYRKFYDQDLQRLRYILALQRDHFLPLKVIRERLVEVDSNGGAITPPPAPAAAPRSSAASAPAAPAAQMTGVQMNADELCKAAGIDRIQLDELGEFGLLSNGESYDEHDLVVARAAGRFFEYGVQARHLRMYRQFAEKETSFFQQIVTPVARRKDPAGQEEASRSLQELAGLSRQIKEATLRSTLRDLL